METENLPTVIASSEIEILPGLKITVHVLDNGQRIIPAEDFAKACEFLGVSPELFGDVLKGMI